MMTSWNGNIFRVTGPLCGEFTGHRWIPHTKWRGALICAWINDWVNNVEAGDLRRHRAHYDVIVMNLLQHVFPVLYGELTALSSQLSQISFENRLRVKVMLSISPGKRIYANIQQRIPTILSSSFAFLKIPWHDIIMSMLRCPHNFPVSIPGFSTTVWDVPDSSYPTRLHYTTWPGFVYKQTAISKWRHHKQFYTCWNICYCDINSISTYLIKYANSFVLIWLRMVKFTARFGGLTWFIFPYFRGSSMIIPNISKGTI